MHVLSFTDITDRKKAEETLDKYTRTWRSLLTSEPKNLSLPRYMLEVFLKQVWTRWLQSVRTGRLLMLTRLLKMLQVVLARNLSVAIFRTTITEPEEARTVYNRVFTEGFVKDYPLVLKHKTGQITQVLYNASIYRNPQDEIQGVFAAARDITES